MTLYLTPFYQKTLERCSDTPTHSAAHAGNCSVEEGRGAVEAWPKAPFPFPLIKPRVFRRATATNAIANRCGPVFIEEEKLVSGVHAC